MSRRVLTGKVVSDRNENTVTVLVERRFMHPLVKKTIGKTKKYCAHDPGNSARIGQMVRIRECAPISKTKRWEVIADSSA